jgi:hypothetical protein
MSETADDRAAPCPNCGGEGVRTVLYINTVVSKPRQDAAQCQACGITLPYEAWARLGGLGAALDAAEAENERLRKIEAAYRDVVPFLAAHGLLEVVEDEPTA